MKRFLSHLPIGLLLLVTSISGCAQSTAPTSQAIDSGVNENVRPLLRLMTMRLNLMHDVARWKWNNNRPVSDPQREEQLLDRLDDQAQAAGLDRTLARTFFEAQIEAAKVIQQADFDVWQSENRPPFEEAPDLKTELRPQISKLSEQLVAQLAALEDSLDDEEVQAAIRDLGSEVFRESGFDERMREICLKPLLVVKPR